MKHVNRPVVENFEVSFPRKDLQESLAQTIEQGYVKRKRKRCRSNIVHDVKRLNI
jgi:hypothetical protein